LDLAQVLMLRAKLLFQHADAFIQIGRALVLVGRSAKVAGDDHRPEHQQAAEQLQDGGMDLEPARTIGAAVVRVRDDGLHRVLRGHWYTPVRNVTPPSERCARGRRVRTVWARLGRRTAGRVSSSPPETVTAGPAGF